jgi:hypothetical protein
MTSGKGARGRNQPAEFELDPQELHDAERGSNPEASVELGLRGPTERSPGSKAQLTRISDRVPTSDGRFEMPAK